MQSAIDRLIKDKLFSSLLIVTAFSEIKLSTNPSVCLSRTVKPVLSKLLIATQLLLLSCEEKKNHGKNCSSC